MTHLTLLDALVVTNAMLQRLTNRRFIIIIIITKLWKKIITLDKHLILQNMH